MDWKSLFLPSKPFLEIFLRGSLVYLGLFTLLRLKLKRLIHPAPLLLVKDGKLIRRNMRKELITEDEIISYVRKQGLDDIARVKEAYMEGDGLISVIAEQKPESRPEFKKKIK